MVISSFRPWAYDLMMHSLEVHVLSSWRRDMLKPLEGDILEVGAGTGASLQFYAPSVRARVVLSEPDKALNKSLSKSAFQFGYQPPSLLICENLLYPDESFDFVVSFLVLCCVKNQASAIKEIHRVLRPNGVLIFVEHILAPAGSVRNTLQRCLRSPWQFFACGCDVCRRTDLVIPAHGFEWSHLVYEDICAGPEILRSLIRGAAIKLAVGL